MLFQHSRRDAHADRQERGNRRYRMRQLKTGDCQPQQLRNVRRPGGAGGLFAHSGGRWKNWTRADGLSNQEVLSLGAGADGSPKWTEFPAPVQKTGSPSYRKIPFSVLTQMKPTRS